MRWFLKIFCICVSLATFSGILGRQFKDAAPFLVPGLLVLLVGILVELKTELVGKRRLTLPLFAMAATLLALSGGWLNTESGRERLGVETVRWMAFNAYRHGGIQGVKDFCRNSSPIYEFGAYYNCAYGRSEEANEVFIMGYHAYGVALAAKQGSIPAGLKATLFVERGLYWIG